jgi:hypothetical protein
MKRLLTGLILFSVPFSAALANPGVTKNTDVGKNKVKRHHQVTWTCEDGSGTCKTASVEEFAKPVADQRYRQMCDVVVRGNKRYMSCTTVKAGGETVASTTQTRKDNKTETVQSWQPAGPNRFSLHVGRGPTGLKTDETADRTKVKEDMDVVIGAGYSRVVYKNLSLGVSIYSNKTVTGSLGFDF